MVKNRADECLGPFTLLGVNADKKIGFIQDNKTGKAIHFILAQLETYFHPSDIAQSLFCGIQQEFNYLRSDQLEEHDVFLTEIINSADPRAD